MAVILVIIMLIVIKLIFKGEKMQALVANFGHDKRCKSSKLKA